MGRTRAALLVAALAAGAAPTTALAATEDAAERLRERAVMRVAASPACPRDRLGLAAPAQTPVTEAPLDPAWATSFALFRRAAGPAEAAAAGDVPLSALTVEETFAQGTRTVRLSDGTRATLRVHGRARVPAATKAIAACLARVHREVRRLGRGAAERRALAGLPAAQARSGATGQGVTLSVRRGSEAGVAAAVLAPAQLTRRPLFAKIADGPNFARVVMVVPDEVRSVRIEYPARELKLTTFVRGNVVSIAAPLPYREATPKRILWFDGGGRKLRG